MSSYVLDASAVLALLNDERGADVVQSALTDATCFMSVVNWSEVARKLVTRSLAVEPVAQTLVGLGLEFKEFDYSQAICAARLDAPALSLGDRACLALAQSLGVVALTADQIWQTFTLDIPVQLIRP